MLSARYLSRNMDDSKVLKDILETVVFIKDNAASKADLAAFEERMASKADLERFATKEDLAAFELRVATKEDLAVFATKEDLRAMKNEVMTHLDALVVGHKKFVVELAAVQYNYRHLDTQLQQLAKHVNFSFQGI